MTDASKLKAKIRARAQRTGESYAAARRHVLAQLDAERQAKTAESAERARKAPATGAVSDDRCREKTGHGFEYWFGVLDRFGARKAGHTAAARHLQQDHNVSAWYAQSITVAYERVHGLREIGQQGTGTYQVSVSRVLPVDAEMACDLLRRDTAIWLDNAAGKPGESLRQELANSEFQPSKRGYRLRYRPDTSIVELTVDRKPDGRSSLVARHSEVPDRKTLDRLRDRWRAILDRFREHCRSI
ncbi:MAG: hypothetical protein AAF481_17085 [Acidobacteriota bacterium]